MLHELAWSPSSRPLYSSMPGPPSPTDSQPPGPATLIILQRPRRFSRILARGAPDKALKSVLLGEALA